MTAKFSFGWNSAPLPKPLPSVCSNKNWEELPHLLLKQTLLFQAMLFTHIPVVHIWLKTILGIEYKGWSKIVSYQGFHSP